MNETEAREILRPMLRTGMTIHTTTENGRGMTDYVRVLIARKGNVVDITHLTAKVTGIRFNADRQALVMGGCGYSEVFSGTSAAISVT